MGGQKEAAFLSLCVAGLSDTTAAYQRATVPYLVIVYSGLVCISLTLSLSLCIYYTIDPTKFELGLPRSASMFFFFF
jgi:hypothetical protein